jgi:PST family polysaccharide transporter
MVESGGLSLLSLIMLLVVARVIGPTEFGTVALVLGIVQILFVISDTLLHDAIVQRRYLSTKHLDTAFWTCVVVGWTFAIACWLGSGLVARLFSSPSMEPLLAVAGISLLAGSMGSVPLALLRRDKRFKPIALRSLCARLSGALVALAFVLIDMGIWSLIAQYVVQTTLNAALVWPALKWRPRLRFSFGHLRQLMSFGMFAVGSRIVWISSARLFMMFVGYFLGVTAAGTLNIAQRVVDTLYDLLAGAAYNLALPYFAKQQGDPRALVRIYKTTMDFGALTTFPIFIGLMICAPLIVATFLGEQWLSAVPLVRLLAIAATFHFILLFAQVAIMAIGRPAFVFTSSLLTFGFIIGMFLIIRPETPVGAAALWACRAFLAGPWLLTMAHRLLGISTWEIAKIVAAPAASVLIMLAVLLAVDGSLVAPANIILKLAFMIGVGAMAYLAAICLINAASVGRLAGFIISGVTNRTRAR